MAEENAIAGAVKTDEQRINTICKVAGNTVVRQDMQINGNLERDITTETAQHHNHRCFAN